MQTECPKCGHPVDCPESPADSVARCPACGTLFDPPAAKSTASPDASSPTPAFAGLEAAQAEAGATSAQAAPPSPPSRSRARLLAVALPVLALLVAGGIYAKVRMDRAAFAKKVDARFAAAEADYLGGRMEDCDRGLSEVAGMAAARPEAIPGEQLARIGKRSEELRAHIARWREAAAAMKAVSAEPAATRRRMAELHGAIVKLGPDAEPVERLVRAMCERAYDEELAGRRRDLAKRLDAVKARLDEGDLDSARASLKAARDEIAAAPGDMAARLREAFDGRFAESEAALLRLGLEKRVSAFLAKLDAGDFEAARTGLKAARDEAAAAPAAMTAGLQEAFRARFDELDAALKVHDELAAMVAAAAPAGPKRAAVEKKLLERRAGLTASGPAASGFARRFDQWVAELRTDRRPLPSAIKTNRADLEALAKDFSAALPGLAVPEGGLDAGRSLLRLEGAGHSWRVMLCQLGEQPSYMIEVDGVRLAYPALVATAGKKIDPDLRRAMIRCEMNQAPILAATLLKSGGEDAWSPTPWSVTLFGTARGAEPLALLGEKDLLCTAGRVWSIEGEDSSQELRAAVQGFVGATQALEKALAADKAASKELKAMLGVMVRDAYQVRRSASDFLPRRFCSEAVARGYIELNAPDLGARLKEPLAAYRGAYRALTEFRGALSGKTEAGDELGLSINADGRTLWRVYDAGSDTTDFGLQPGDDQIENQFFVHTVFAGKHESWPAADLPKAVRMVHLLAGEVSRWDPATDKLTFDAARWSLAAGLDEFRKAPAHFGAPDWRFPPHVLLLDPTGGILGLVTPSGRLDMPEFGRRTGEERRKLQNAFLDRCAKCLPSPGDLHLLFVYFMKYTYDSPLTDYPMLIGDKQNTGDVHQDAYQTLDRKVAGRFIGDCDDLAELYQEITRRQGRLSYVLGQPSHAICGFVDRAEKDYVFTVVDTGPPRSFRAARLEDALEAGYATFDEEKTETFDPSSLTFLLRFAGEPTRTPYWLGARMFLDPQYAETMIRVQRDWHFAYIIAGRDTMAEMVKREHDAPTLFELAAFHRELADWKLAAEWSRKGIAAMAPEDIMGRINEQIRLATYLERAGDRDGSAKVLLDGAAELDKAEAAGAAGAEAAKSGRFTGPRFMLAMALVGLDRPWDGWRAVAPAARRLSEAGELSGENASRLAGVLQSMRELEAGGKRPAAESDAAGKELEGLLDKTMSGRLFKERDTLMDVMGTYGNLAAYYAAKHGRAYVLERLLAPGPYPSGPRAHHRRSGSSAATEAEDWKWIRLSVPAYLHFFGQALDSSKPVAERRTEEAVRIMAALEKALPEIEKQGSLSNMEFAILSVRVQRDAITKNWAGMEETFKLMKRRDWARLYRLVATSLGGAAEYMTPAEFEAQFRKFSEQSPPLPHYYRAAYEALGEKNYEAALAGARITAGKFPDNEEVQREYRLLQEFVAKRKAGEAGGQPNAAPDGGGKEK